MTPLAEALFKCLLCTKAAESGRDCRSDKLLRVSQCQDCVLPLCRYVGGAPGKIDLYVGKEVVRRAIPMDDATNQLIELIKEHDRCAQISPSSRSKSLAALALHGRRPYVSAPNLELFRAALHMHTQEADTEGSNIPGGAGCRGKLCLRLSACLRVRSYGHFSCLRA